MTNRIMMALVVGGGLLLARPALAQIPPEQPTEDYRQVSAEQQEIPAEPGWSEVDASPRSGERFWLTSEGVLGWISGTPLPPLVTLSPPGTAQATAGILGNATTTSLQNGDVNEDARVGLRLSAGYWFDAEHTFGVEAGFTVLESEATIFAASPTDVNPILARPYVDANTNLQQAVLIAFPGSSTGTVEVKASSGNFYEAHLDFTETFIDRGWFRMESIFGYRFYHYDDGLRIRQSVSPTNPNFATGTEIVSEDDFGAQSQFHGGDIGLRTDFSWSDLSVSLLAKAAVGNVNQQVNIEGSQVTSAPGVAPVVNSGGVYALSSNVGTHRSNDWTVLPEFGANLNWQFNSHVSLTGGYSILFLDRIVRAADQIDLTVNPNLFPPPVQPLTGPNRPAFNMERADIFMQSISIGLEIRF